MKIQGLLTGSCENMQKSMQRNIEMAAATDIDRLFWSQSRSNCKYWRLSGGAVSFLFEYVATAAIEIFKANISTPSLFLSIFTNTYFSLQGDSSSPYNLRHWHSTSRSESGNPFEIWALWTNQGYSCSWYVDWKGIHGLGRDSFAAYSEITFA